MDAAKPRLTADNRDRAAAEPTPAALRRHAQEERRRSFLRMVSHELRTPLNSIIGFSDIIAGELYGPIGDARYREHAGIIRESGARLLKLANQVMEIVRLESGAADLDVRPISLTWAAEEVIRLLEPEADRRQVTLAITMVGGETAARADARGLKAALHALVQNAVAHSPEGATVTIGLTRRGATARISVRDTGPGIPARQVGRLMRPFEQGESALTRHGEGAGLGLPVARLFCQAMGGRLRLHRPAGGGLLAVMRLPAADPAEAA